MMDYQKAINNCNVMISDLKKNMVDGIKIRHIYMVEIRTLKTAISAMQELQEYKQIGTLEEVREAVEKQNAIEPEDEEYCPLCHTFLKDDDGVPGYYCPNCGQAIHWKDWSDEE